MLENFLRLRKISDGRSSFNEMLFTPVARSPLSSLPRDGGDVRGGSVDFFYSVAALPHCVLCGKTYFSARTKGGQKCV